MKRTDTTTIATYAVLGVAAAVVFALPSSVVPIASATPIEPLSWSTIRLNGVVRDFKAAHPDFDVTPVDGLGHRAGTVAASLGPGNRPVFNAGSDINGPFENRIAHWKFNEGTGSVVADELGTNDGTLVSGSWDAGGREGAAVSYDGDDYVEIPNSPDMQIAGDITFAGWFKLNADFDGTQPTMVIMEKFLDVNHDFHIGLAGADYNRPEVPKGAMVFKVENGPTSDYYCYVWTLRQSWQADTWYHFACSLDSGDTVLNSIYIDGADDTDSTIAAGIGFLDTNYDAPMRIGGKTIDYNGYATDIYFDGMIDDVMIFDRALTPGDLIPSPGGYEVAAQWTDASGNKIAPHQYTPAMIPPAPPVLDACGTAIEDVSGTAGAPSSGGVTSAGSFSDWFGDVLGVNLSTQRSIELTLDGTVYEFIDDTHFPIDGTLLGNEGDTHNRYFTHSIAALFTYSSCTGQFVEFDGGDGAWVFINGELVIDLGGVLSGHEQRIDLDRLALVDGDLYEMRLFYAQRNSGSSRFALRTNMVLLQHDHLSVSAGFD